MKDLNLFLKQTIFYGLSSVVARVLNFLLVPLYTYIFIPEQYGVITEMYAYAVFIMILSTLSIETAFFKFSNDNRDKRMVYSTASSLLLITSIILIFIAIFCTRNISELIGGIDSESYANYVFYFLLIISIDTLCVIPFAKLRLQEKAAYFAIIKIINILINIGCNLFFYLYLGEIKIDYVFISNLLASGLTFLILIPNIENFSLNIKLSRKMLKYSYPLIIGGMAYAVNETLDKILIKYLCNESPLEQVGIYSACYKLSIFMILFVQSYRLAAEPLFFNYQTKLNAKKNYAQLMKLFIIIAMFLFLIITLNLNYLKFFISNKSYHTGLHIVPIILLAHVCLGIYYNLSLWYKLTNQTKYGAIISLLGCVITLTINILFIPIYGYITAAWATLFCYMTMMLISYFLGQRKYPIPYELRPIVSYIVFALIIYFIKYNFDLNGIINTTILVSIYIISILYIEGWYKKIKLIIK